MTLPPLTHSPAPDASLDDAIDSAQRTESGAPRFRVPAHPTDPAWAEAAAREAEQGVAAEVRVFLDGQLGTGDLLLDLAPGFGFVALTAATAESGVPTVLVAEPDAARLSRLQDAAADAGAWLEPLDGTDAEALDRAIEQRLDQDARLFLHLDDAQCVALTATLQRCTQTGQLLAVLISEPVAEVWPTTHAALRAAGLRACTLGENDTGVVLLPVETCPAGGLIAVPEMLFGEPEGAQAGGASAPAATTAAATTAAATTAAATTAAATTAGAPAPTAFPRVMHRGFSFIAPHARTGYGVTAAHLLRAVQARGVPVAFFPLGGVDARLTENPHLDYALDSQAGFPSTAPSVRLSQQFDLALHAGRGPRLGFPIFEADTFTPRERHHLAAQDALLVCTPWAHEVCRANGLTLPVHVVPLGVDARIFHPDVTPLRSSTDTVFLHVGKLEARKGQRELLRAFEAAFSPKDAVRLVFACHNPFVNRDTFEAQLAPFRTSRLAHRITLHTTELPTAHDVAALMASADCGVFPARAEGWNLELLEMLALGKTVIASESTGHTAYLTRDNGIGLTMGPPEPATAGGFLGSWPSWGEAQHEQLVDALRRVHAQRQAGGLGVNLAGVATARAHTWDASADALLQAVEQYA